MHTNTRLTVHSRYWMIRQYEQGVPVKVLAEQYHISHATFYRWLKRYWKEGYEGLMNRSSRPQKIHYRLTPAEELRLEELRLSHRWGPARLGNQMGVPSITVYRHLLRSGMNRLPRPPRAAVVRYEMSAPGELVHLDIMYLFALRGKKTVYQFSLVDGYTRMAHAFIAPHKSTEAALQAVREAQEYFGFPIQRVLTHNDVAFAWTPRRGWPPPKGGITRFTRTLQEWGIRHSTTRVRRPQTNGKVERWHRTVREELYRAHPLFSSEEQRSGRLEEYLDYYNNQRYHTAIEGMTPVQRREQFYDTQKVSTTS